MILITYTEYNLETQTKQLDYVQLKTLNDIWDWLKKFDGEINFILNRKKRTLTPKGWVPLTQNISNIIQIITNNGKMVVNIDKIISNYGIIFESINHCSQHFSLLIALKCEIALVE